MLLLLVALMGQQVIALEFTKTLAAEEVAAEVINAPTLEEAKNMLDRCSVEERKLVTQALQQALLQWVALYGFPADYTDRYASKQMNAALSGVVAVISIGAAVLAVTKLVYSVLNAQDYVNQAGKAYNAMGKTTNEKWLGKSVVVNGVLISSPYFVDGQQLGYLCDALNSSFGSFEGIEHYMKTAGYCALAGLFFGAGAKLGSDEASDMQQNLERHDRIQSLIAYLDK